MLRGITRIPALPRLLAALDARGQRWGVVTSAPRRLALAKIAEVDLPEPDSWSAPRTSPTVKLHPAPYLAGAAQLGRTGRLRRHRRRAGRCRLGKERWHDSHRVTHDSCGCGADRSRFHRR